MKEVRAEGPPALNTNQGVPTAVNSNALSALLMNAVQGMASQNNVISSVANPGRFLIASFSGVYNDVLQKISPLCKE